MTAYSQVRGAELQIFVQNILTADNCANARDVLLGHCQRSEVPNVVLDLQKTTYIDTPGLSLLLEIKKELTGRARTLILQNPSRAILRILNLTRMNRVFPVRMTTVEHERIPGLRSGDADPLGIPVAGERESR